VPQQVKKLNLKFEEGKGPHGTPASVVMDGG